MGDLTLEVHISLELKIPSEIEFYSVANRINQIFHEASVNKNNRAVYLGSIILAISEGEIDTRPNLILKQINSNMESALEKAGKKDLIKILKNMGEKGKIAIRNIRREANEDLKKKLKDKTISEDDSKNFEKNIQKLTDSNIENIDKTLSDKEKEIIQI